MNEALEKKLNDAMAKHEYENALGHCEALFDAGESNSHLKAVKGWCLYQMGELKDAEALLVEAFNEDPTQHFSATMVMSYYMDRGHYQQVVTIAQYCAGLHSKDRLIWHRLGTAHFMQGDLEGAVIAFRRSLHVEYSKLTSFALSQPLLCQGKYEEGFELYEYRFDSYPKLNWPQAERMPMPQWQGEPLQGKSILIWTEQGLGDCIQFSRFVTQLVEQGASVDLMLPNAHGALAELLHSVDGVERVSVIQKRDVTLRRKYDYQSPMMSLMKSINLRPTQTPSSIFPYLFIPETKKASQHNTKLSKQLALPLDKAESKQTLKVGVVWTTALLESFKKKDYLHFKQKDRKSLRTSDVLPILQLDGFEFFSLHVAKSEALQNVLDNHDIVDMSDSIGDFTDTAIAIDAMDFVLSIDTSVAHLAGALNKPVINLLPFAADWRWQMNREDTPWYPSMRLLRQSTIDDWSVVTVRLQALLPKIAKRYEQTGKVDVFL